MSEQPKQNQMTTNTETQAPQQISEQTKKDIIDKVKDLFRKEKFRTSTYFANGITNPEKNSIPVIHLIKDRSITSLINDQIAFTEILKSPELKDVVIYDEKDDTVSPTWRKLRNIVYFIQIPKDIEQIAEIIKKEIEATQMTADVFVNDDSQQIKITVTTPGQEEEHAKQLFKRFFNVPFEIEGQKINCYVSIEEEQFVLPTSFPSSHTGQLGNRQGHPTISQHPPNMINPMYFQQMMMQQLIAMQNGNRQFAQQRKQGKNFKNPGSANQNKQFHAQNPKLGNPINQPSQRSRNSNNNKKYNKGNLGSGRQNRPNRVFNEAVSDANFPSLQ